MISTEVDSQQFTVNDREQLIYLLTEAAEIEHGLLCSYLYAMWSLKRSPDEGLSADQAEAINHWRKSIHSVAMEEMLHLALVSNLLMSIGSPPHFSRPNFPLVPGYHPASVVVRLTPFTRDTADHFVYLERPEGTDIPYAKGFEPPAEYERQSSMTRLTPSAEDYDTVSHLYRGIEEGFVELSARLGESALCLGDPAVQLTRELLDLPGLIPVTDLASARAAIGTIIEQGEGSAGDRGEDSHFQRFSAIREQYDQFLAEDADFMPHRPVVSDPVMFHPLVPEGQAHIRCRPTARVLDLANACYGLMLRLLASGIGMASGTSAARQAEIDGAMAMMSVMDSLAVQLTTLPADQGSATAGLNFHLPRSTLALPQRPAGTTLLAERARELAKAARTLESEHGVDPSLAPRLETVATGLQSAIEA